LILTRPFVNLHSHERFPFGISNQRATQFEPVVER